MILARCESRKLSKKIRKSLRKNTQEWCLAVGGLTHGDFRIVLIPRRIRLFDGVRLYYGNSEIWLPLLQRLFIRSRVRYILAMRSNRVWDETHPEKVDTGCQD